jgi:hypothetical protein
MDAYTESKLETWRVLQTLIQVSHGIEDTQARAYGPMSIIFMGLGIAKIDEQPIPQELGDVPIVTLDNVGTHPLIRTDDVPILFWV